MITTIAGYIPFFWRKLFVKVIQHNFSFNWFLWSHIPKAISHPTIPDGSANNNFLWSWLIQNNQNHHPKYQKILLTSIDYPSFFLIVLQSLHSIDFDCIPFLKHIWSLNLLLPNTTTFAYNKHNGTSWYNILNILNNQGKEIKSLILSFVVRRESPWRPELTHIPYSYSQINSN